MMFIGNSCKYANCMVFLLVLSGLRESIKSMQLAV